jgi:hypothetical protein
MKPPRYASTALMTHRTMEMESMIKRLELIGPSCLTNAKDDEPIFVLKSTDELAPAIVREWADRYLITKTEQPGGITEKQLAKYREACALAVQMDAWPSSQSDAGVNG